ncbi:MAG: response regulator [Pseudomonadota bacterium]
MNMAIQHGRILIIDDNVDAGDILGILLEIQGYECRIARSGEEGLLIYKEFLPRAIVCDLRMPGMSGFEFAQKLRKLDPAAFLVALTGADIPHIRHQCDSAGFDLVLFKPASFDVIHSSIAVAFCTR